MKIEPWGFRELEGGTVRNGLGEQWGAGEPGEGGVLGAIPGWQGLTPSRRWPFRSGQPESLVVGNVCGGCRVRATLGTREFGEQSALFSPAS